jgi:hypothetical protein
VSFDPVGFVVAVVTSDDELSLPWTSNVYTRQRVADDERDGALASSDQDAELGQVRVFALIDVTR